MMQIGTYFSRSELSTLVRLHASRHLLDPGEAAAMTGALSFRNKKVWALPFWNKKLHILMYLGGEEGGRS